jgi:4'-phosphopantetheinyl transferase
MPSPDAATATLLPGEIHLYLVDDAAAAAAPAQLAAYRALLTPAEAERWARLHFQRHRDQFLVTRALVRGVLSLYAHDIGPADWRFDVNRYGRPMIAPGMAKSLEFNLSHTEGRVVLAVATAPQLGVDIEWCARPGSPLETADSFFSPEEVAMLRALPPARHLRRFYDIWTLKEAYIKARGMGLSLPLAEFSIRFADEAGLGIAFAPGTDQNPADWHLWQVGAGPDYALSLALSATGGWRPRLFLGAPLSEFTEVECRVLRSSAQL